VDDVAGIKYGDILGYLKGRENSKELRYEF
jgi:hypothetical protein